MNDKLNKPDESTLMAYAYGELEGEEKMRVEAYLREHPEEKARLEDWSFVRHVMGQMEDKEVIAPPIIVDNASRRWWQESYFRVPLGMAASFMLMLVMAKWMGLSAAYSDGEFRLAFGTTEKLPVAAPLTEDKVKELIQVSLTANNEKLADTWSTERTALERSMKSNMQQSSSRIDKLMQTASVANQEEVKRFVGQMQKDNLKLMKDYLQLSSNGQKEYIETLLVDFSKYLQEQRKQDMQLFQTRMTSIEQNTDQFKQETEQILTSLISQSGPVTNQKSN